MSTRPPKNVRMGALLLLTLMPYAQADAASATRTTGFIPGEWRITTVTRGALVGSSSTTTEICLNGLDQTTIAPGDSAQVAAPGEAGAVHNIITQRGGATILESRFSVHSTTPGSGSAAVESYSGREVYQRDPLHRSVMSGTGTLIYKTGQGKIVYTFRRQGYWLSGSCLAHPPRPVTQTLTPSIALQSLLSQEKKTAQPVQPQNTQPGSPVVTEKRVQAQEKLMYPLEQESNQALQDHDMPKFLKLQAQIRAIEKTADK